MAYALGRATGPAVVRNRLRRQLRAAVAATHTNSTVQSGWYLIGADAPATSFGFAELSARVPELMNSAAAKNAARQKAAQ